MEHRTPRLTGTLLLFASAALLLVRVAQGQTSSPPFDVVIEHGHVIDGTGSLWYAADISI